MKTSDDFQFVIGRIIGGVVTGAVAFGMLSMFNSWDFGPLTIIGLAVFLGVLVSVFGGGLVRWIMEMLPWL